jgi:hypothetical protein
MQWRIPIGFQLVPVGIMLCMLPFLKESPRWLATKHRDAEALKNLAWIRKTNETDPETHQEMAEILAAIAEEEKLSKGLSWKEALAPSNRIRFMIAFRQYIFLGSFTLLTASHLYLTTVQWTEQYQLLVSDHPDHSRRSLTDYQRPYHLRK